MRLLPALVRQGASGSASRSTPASAGSAKSGWFPRTGRSAADMRLGPLDVVGPGDTRPAKSVDDAKWSSFIGMLAYKAVRYGRTLVRVGRFTPASQTRHACGTVDGPKPLNVREWTCNACRTVHDRDHNAALNIKQATGLAVRACRAPVRPEPVLAQREETGSHGFHSHLVMR
ncbi:transposase [Streptomyces canus]